MAHTPGPWVVNTLNGKIPVVRELKSNVGEASRYHAAIIRDTAPPFERVCNLDFGYGKPDDEANARLIAAAPDLLEACTKAAMRMEFGDDTENETYNKLEQAIAKAKGD